MMYKKDLEWAFGHLERVKDFFPDLYALVVDGEASVASYLANPSKGEVMHWNPPFVQPFQDWELELVINFFELLYKCLPSSLGGDWVLWTPTKSGIFKIRSYYKAFRGFTCHSFPWKSI